MSRGMIAVGILIAAGYVSPAPGQSTSSVLEVELRNARTDKWMSIGPQGGQIQALSVDPHNSRTLYAATYPASGNAVAFKSLDGGAHWAPSGGPNAPLVFDPQDSNTIYALQNGISKSTDGGTSWKPANSGLPPAGVSGTSPQVIALAIDPLHPSTLYAGTQLGLFKSSDAGTSWSSAGSGLPLGSVGIPTAHYVNLVVIDPQNPSTLYAVADLTDAPGGLLFKSTDGGANWGPAGSGLPMKPITLAIDPQNPRTLYADSFFGTFKSTDGGAGWIPVNSGLPMFGVAPALVADSLAIDPQQPGTVYVAKSTLSGGRVYKTTNGGATWSEASSGLPQGFINSLKIAPQTSTTLYVATTFGVYKSADAGASWVAVDSGLTAIAVLDLAVDPRNSRTLYAATPYGFFETTDGGVNWSPPAFRLGPPLVIDPQNTSTVFAMGCNAAFQCGVAKRTDGGASWSVSGFLNFNTGEGIDALAIDPRDSNILYAATNDSTCTIEKLYKSVDGGVSWSRSPFPDMSAWSSCVLALAVDPQNSANLYAAFSEGGVFKSTDAGATWSAANSGLSAGSPFYSAFALAIDPSSARTVYTVTLSGVFKSCDGATTWSPASSGLPDWSKEYSGPRGAGLFPRLVIDPQNYARLYLGIVVAGAQRVFESSDGGASWVDSGLAVTGNSDGFFGGLAISSQGPSTVYAGSLTGVFALRFVPGRQRPKD